MTDKNKPGYDVLVKVSEQQVCQMAVCCCRRTPNWPALSPLLINAFVLFAGLKIAACNNICRQRYNGHVSHVS